MLSLAPVFSDAILSLAEGAESLQSAPLAATVFLMQRDVLNQYRYALSHYLPLDLAAPFLQNSSIGTPYQKWAKFTNDDFSCLSFHVGNLLRYTSRLLNETVAAARLGDRQFSESKTMASRYIPALVGMKMASQLIGLRVEPDQRISVLPLWDDEHPSQPNTFSIGTTLERLEAIQRVTTEGEAELSELTLAHNEYAEKCRSYYQSHDVVTPFDALHPMYAL